MLQVDRVLWRIRQDEGFRSAPYQCIADVWTFGYGTTRYRDELVKRDTPPIGIREARLYLRSDVLSAIDDCQAIYSNFGELHTVHQEVLVCLAYQLGRPNLQGFRKMNEAIEAFDMVGFARELRDSKLFRQTTKRVKRYLTTIAEHQWPE